MTAIAERVPCPHCGYTAENAGSIPAHVAMYHPEVPMDAVAPKRSARNTTASQSGGAAAPERTEARPSAKSASPDATTSAAAPEPRFLDGSAPTGSRARRATPGPVPAAGGPTSLPIADIVVEDNVREDLGDLEGLVESIREHGLLQAVLVDQRADGSWRLVDGHRRLEASKRAELVEIPVQVAPRAFEAGARTTVQIVANSHRRDLNPIEEAEGYRSIIDRDGITQAELARRLSKDPSTIANALRLLDTAPKVQELLRSKALTPAHAKAIAGLALEDQADLAERAVRESWSGHETERQAKWAKDNAKGNAERRERAAAAAVAIVDAAKKTAGKAAIYVRTAAIADALEAAGFTVVRSWEWNAAQTYDGKACGCTAFIVEWQEYYSNDAKLKRACTSKEHAQARSKARDDQWAKNRADDEAKRKAANEARVRDAVPVFALLEQDLASPMARRVLLYLLVEDDYDNDLVERYVPNEEAEEAEEAEGDVAWLACERVPDDELAAALAKEVVDRLTSGWQPHDAPIAAVKAAGGGS